MRLVVDGEGLHEDPVRLQSHGCCLHTRLQAWDLSAGASIVAEENMGLGLLRPVLSEMSQNCEAMREPPVVGPTVAELLSTAAECGRRFAGPRGGALDCAGASRVEWLAPRPG
eukprot:3592439-Prymnesium_polylepis.2